MLEQLSEYSKITNKPINDLFKLQTETFKHWMSDLKTFNECMTGKNPTDIISAQNKLLNDTTTELLQYIQEANKIWFKASSEMNKSLNNNRQEAIAKTSRLAKKAKKTYKTASRSIKSKGRKQRRK